MSKRLIKIIIANVLIIAIGAITMGCSLLYPTSTTTAATVAGQTTTTTAAPATGWRAIFSSYGTWIWLIILAVAFYFLLIRPQRTRSKKAQELMSSLKRGDEIVTIGGIFGRIKDVREDTIIITIAGGVDVKITKSAIARTISSAQGTDTGTR
jgi:preprotein translocase subunit YajC